ncbi:MAG: nitroreductase family protein [Halioglobus sp.]
MPHLNLSADELLTTTRAVRKRLDLDKPVAMSVLKECLEIALQAPSGSNSQGWHFILVTDTHKKAALAALYQKAFAEYESGPAQPTMLHTDDPSMREVQQRVLSSAQYLADNLARVPAMLIPCCSGNPDAPGLPLSIISGIYGSILPAVWSFMLAARERGLGTCWTTLHLNYADEAAALLNIPDDFSQVALIPIAYTRGTDFKVAPRKSLDHALHTNGW